MEQILSGMRHPSAKAVRMQVKKTRDAKHANGLGGELFVEENRLRDRAAPQGALVSDCCRLFDSCMRLATALSAL